MQITPPFGFREVVPLQRTHGVRLPAPGALPDFAPVTNAIPVSYSEFAVASHDYPIVFTSNDEGKTYAAVAVLGLSRGENLFVRDGRWEPNTYVPAYVRRYPFCMSRVRMNDVEQQQRLICVEKAYLAEDGEKLFDAEGKPLERWAPIEKLLNEYEADLDRTREMCAILADYALMEPFSLQASVAGGAPFTLSGMARVDEKKLEFLNAAQTKNLFKKGIMGRIYAHLISLDNFQRLLGRRAAAAPPAAAA
ncbi:MAG: SapC family protein [Burkholderiales bacterium]|nr:SapC family protein [Burkholderiales bacterium]